MPSRSRWFLLCVGIEKDVGMLRILSVCCHIDEWGLAPVCQSVDLRAGIEQRLQAARIVCATREMEGCCEAVRANVWVCAVSQQCL